MSAFTDGANKSFVPRKHHNTMPPFVNIVNKSNILLIDVEAIKKTKNYTENWIKCVG